MWLIDWVSHQRFEDLPEIARVWGWWLYWVLFKRRRIMLDNLRRVFPHWDKEERKKIAYKSLSYMVLAVLDTLWAYGRYCQDPDLFRNWFLGEGSRLAGREGLAVLLKQGGLICTAHYGTFTALVQYFAFHQRTGVFLKKIKNPYLQLWADRIIREMGSMPLYIDEVSAVKKAVGILRSNGVVVVLLDQHFGRDGRIKVDFFGYPAFTAGGAVELAMRMDKQVVAMFCRREEKNFVILDKGILWPREGVSSSKDVVQYFTRLLEDVIMVSPEQWAWLHRRWKV